MHELAITQDILQSVCQHAQQAQAVRVTDIYIVVGKLSSIVDESVSFCWKFISDGTICAGARLHFNNIPAVFRCMDCSHSFTMNEMLSPCPQCQSARLEVTSGEEFYLDSIEIEK